MGVYVWRERESEREKALGFDPVIDSVGNEG